MTSPVRHPVPAAVAEPPREPELVRRHVHWHDICRVQVDPAGFPVDAKVIHQKPNGPKETRTEFFVRVANGTKSLDVVEREKYIAQRWGSA